MKPSYNPNNIVGISLSAVLFRFIIQLSLFLVYVGTAKDNSNCSL